MADSTAQVSPLYEEIAIALSAPRLSQIEAPDWACKGVGIIQGAEYVDHYLGIWTLPDELLKKPAYRKT